MRPYERAPDRPTAPTSPAGDLLRTALFGAGALAVAPVVPRRLR